MDPQQAAIASLSREVQLLRAENTYLRGQVRPVTGTCTCLPACLPAHISTSHQEIAEWWGDFMVRGCLPSERSSNVLDRSKSPQHTRSCERCCESAHAGACLGKKMTAHVGLLHGMKPRGDFVHSLARLL